jgi:inner membrane protein
VPSIFTHAVVGAAVAAIGQTDPPEGRVCVAAAICAALPDLDVVTFAFNVPYGHVLGHRGLSHSLAAAAVIALAVVCVIPVSRGPSRVRLWTLLFLAMASHGLLDMCTDGGRGVAILAPFDTTRYFLPWRPIEVSPIGAGFFSTRGVLVIVSEIQWVWLPTALICGVAWAIRRRLRRE